MTVTSGFFNSVNHDRLYDAEQVSSMFDGIITDGVYENYGEALNVTAYSGANSTVIVGTGRAWFDHTWTLNDSQFSITLDPPNELLGRTDSIVIDIDKTQSVRKNSIIYVKGSESTPDLPPTLINTDLHKQYPICYVNRPAGSNKPVTQSDITITVGTSVCPMVTGILEAQNLENLMQQLDDEFNTWWDGIKETLDDNVATNLQNQINEINEKINSDTALVGLLEKPIAEAFMSGDYGISLKSFSITPQGIQTGSNQAVPFFNPLVTILPDGKTMAVYCDVEKIQVCLCNMDGVKTVNNYSYLSDANSVLNGAINVDNAHTFFSCANYANCILDVYPIKFELILQAAKSSSALSSNTYNYGIFHVTYTITSDGTISHTCNGKGIQVEPSGPLQNYTIVRNTSYSRELSSGSYIYISECVTSYDHTNPAPGMVAVAKLTSNGVLSDIVHDSNTVAGSTIYTGDEFCVAEYSDTVVAFPSSKINSDPGIHFVIDEDSLSHTYVGTSLGGSIPSYISKYNAETYSISEQNGVAAQKVVIGSKRQYEDIKKSNYFCGASNLGGAIPEGTFIARNVDSRLYGVGPGGENIAIGTNGGAAILKKKTPVSVTISSTNIVTEFLGYATINGKTIYLLDQNVNNSNNQTFTVVII